MDDALMSEYNMIIQEVMKRSWTITPYEIISSKEFDEVKDNPDLSFLMTTIVSFAKDKTKARYNFISLLMGEPKADVRTMPDLCSLPLSYTRVEEASYHYKLEAFVLFIQNHVKNVLENDKLIGERGFRHYNKDQGSLQGKKLLLTKEDLAKDLQTPQAVKAIYPYDFEIVSREDIADAIKRQDPDVVFLHKVGPEGTRIRARVYKLLVGAADSKLYYWDYGMIKHVSDDAFQEKDLKKLK
ncbi:hypothetical protein [Geofilum rubicundum]|uniref:Uncharacterized protein n=1 Tax=Geofilum rubicundum JCM 15548 TaxID=1236989 RepID=A0A0E9LXH3_9BACT|nr:hypothetical protein [Geofilum rubicundum]GAO29988.1 hypothetical protein JCM15548_12229 [Geofilum rubicundum JCM 15548]